MAMHGSTETQNIKGSLHGKDIELSSKKPTSRGQALGSIPSMFRFQQILPIR